MTTFRMTESYCFWTAVPHDAQTNAQRMIPTLRMHKRYTHLLVFVLFLFAGHAYANDLRLWLFSNNSSVRLDPGQEVTYEYWYDFGDPIDVRLFHPLPPGGTLVRSSDPRWNCARNADGVLCARRLVPDNQPPQT